MTEAEAIAFQAALDQQSSALDDIERAKADGDDERRKRALNDYWDADARLMHFAGEEYSEETKASIARQRAGLDG